MKHLRATAIAMALVMLSSVVAATSQNVKIGEVEGEDRPVLNARGQKNNLDAVPKTTPTQILDGYAYGASQGIPAGRGVQPCDPAKTVPGCAAGVQPYGASFVASRAGLGIPAILYPGGNEFGAWYGNWSDHDDDGAVDAFDRDIGGVPNPATDFDATLAVKGGMAVFIEPGSHPELSSNEAPPASHPDFYMTPPGVNSDHNPEQGKISRGNGAWRQSQGYPIWFYDGSLLRDATVFMVAGPTLDPDGVNLPFKCEEGCLADLDVYAAIAPAPLVELYEDVGAGATVDTLPTIGFSTLLVLDHPTCNPLADWRSPTYVCEEVGPASQKIAPQVKDRRTDPKSSNFGRDYQADYEPWIDTQIQYNIWTPALVSNSLPIGPCDDADFSDLSQSSNTKNCSPPGYLSIGSRTGVWKDLDRNGWIGNRQANPEWGGRDGEDPYLGGWVQDPHDYDGGKAAGEWIGYCAPGSDLPYRKYTNLYYTLTPGPEGWGPAGVFMHYRFPANSGVVTPKVIQTGNPAGTVNNVTADPTTLVSSSEMLTNTMRYSGHITGTTPIKMQVFCYDPDPGRFTGQQVLFFPQGTAGITFTAKLDQPGRVVVKQGGIDIDAQVFDELEISRWLM